jgi:allantoinase
MSAASLPLSPACARPPFRLAAGKSVAVWIGIHVEHWSLLPPAGSFVVKGIHGNWPDHFPDYRTYSFREYGNRIGVFRLFDMLADLDLPASIIVNAEAINRYPAIIEEAERHHRADFILQGRLANRMITSAMPQDEERREIREALDIYQKAFGRPARGWMGPEGAESTRTLQLLAEAGVQFVLDWPNDDVPGVFTTEPPLVSIPYQWEYDDLDLLWTRNVRPWHYDRIITSAYNELARGADGSARVLGLHVRPWLLGQPARIHHLKTVLAALKKRAEAAFLAVTEIAALAKAGHDDASAPSQTDRT